MKTKQLYFAAFVAIFIASPANAVIGPITINLNPTELTSNYFNEDDTSAPFASEIYTQDDIKNSKSNNIFDFLSQNTSLSLAPSSGNKFSQKISTRGHGLTTGSSNIIYTLNGRRLNDIDTSGTSLNTINIKDIEKIEITKGTGSVAYGDSAMAGVIHIYTKRNLDTTISTAMGNYGMAQSSASFGVSAEKIDLNVSMDRLKHGGYSVADPQGNRDKGDQTKSNINARYTTDGGTEFQLDYELSDLKNRYPNYLTQAQFKENPSYNSTGRVYTISERDSKTMTLNIKRQLTDTLTLSRVSSRTDKDTVTKGYLWSDITSYDAPSKYSYDYKTSDYILTYEKGNIKIDSGMTSFDGSRSKLGNNTTTKVNRGFFSQLQYKNNDSIYSIGARNEKIKYKYTPTSGRELNREHVQEAYDLGFNRRMNIDTTIFANYNHAFNAPLIDRFFRYDATNGQEFNGFVQPSESKTINLGLNYLTENSKTKVTLYRSNVSDEMFLCKSNAVSTCSYFGDNITIDKSHKQGLELQNQYIFNPKLSTSLNYAYTIALIDSEDTGSGILNGKTNPMTSKHNISASVRYTINDNANMTLTQKYRSKAFSEEDYANKFSYKQKAYNSTNFNFTFSPNDDLDFKFDIENMFENSYGTWLRDDVIYPGNFTRNINAELSYKF
jgi:iron complex outermembrane receptor protein